MWAEASPGCPRRCQSLRLDTSPTDEADDLFLESVEKTVDHHRAFPFPLDEIDYAVAECVIFWLKIERDFENRNLTTLRLFAEGFAK